MIAILDLEERINRELEGYGDVQSGEMKGMVLKFLAYKEGILIILGIKRK